MSRIEREKLTVRRMIELYCHHHLKQDTMPDEYLFAHSCHQSFIRKIGLDMITL